MAFSFPGSPLIKIQKESGYKNLGLNNWWDFPTRGCIVGKYWLCDANLPTKINNICCCTLFYQPIDRWFINFWRNKIDVGCHFA
jgi:hypothetical protein